VPNPLPPAVHWHADEELELGHLEGRRVPVPHQVTDQRAVIGDLFRAGSIAHTGRLYDCRIVAHAVDEAHEAVVEHGELLPAKLLDPLGVGRHGRIPHVWVLDA
jgi:hypothetical protein